MRVYRIEISGTWREESRRDQWIRIPLDPISAGCNEDPGAYAYIVFNLLQPEDRAAIHLILDTGYEATILQTKRGRLYAEGLMLNPSYAG